MAALKLPRFLKRTDEEKIESDPMSGVVFETSAVCQLRCPHCVRMACGQGPSPSVMPMAVVDRVLPGLRDKESIDLTGWGEPLLNKDLVDIIKKIRTGFGGRITMTTNGLLLDEAKTRALIELGLDTICFSMDAADEESYHAARPGADWDLFKKNLAFFSRMKRKSGVANPLLFAAFLLRREALGSAADFVRTAAELGLDGVAFQQLTGLLSEKDLERVTHRGYFGNDFDERLLDEAMQKAMDAAPPGFTIVLPETIESKRVGGCGGWDITRPFITPAGDVSLCCAMVYDNDFLKRDGGTAHMPSVVFGNLAKNSLAHIWDSPEFRKVRDEIRSGAVPAACGDCIGLYMRPGRVFTK